MNCQSDIQTVDRATQTFPPTFKVLDRISHCVVSSEVCLLSLVEVNWPRGPSEHVSSEKDDGINYLLRLTSLFSPTAGTQRPVFPGSGSGR